MNKLKRSAALLSLVSAMLINGCSTEKQIEESPTCMVKVIGRGLIGDEAGMNGKIKLNDWDPVLTVSGPGHFISAVVSKKGADSDSTTIVKLTLDDQDVSMKSFELASAMGLTGQNYSGIVYLAVSDTIETLVLGYQQQLYFEKRLMLSVKVNDPAVEKIFLYATYTKKDLGNDEKGSGGGGEPPFP